MRNNSSLDFEELCHDQTRFSDSFFCSLFFMIDPFPFFPSLLVLLKDFLPAWRMYAPLFLLSLSSLLSTAVAIAVVRSSNNHKKREDRIVALSHRK